MMNRLFHLRSIRVFISYNSIVLLAIVVAYSIACTGAHSTPSKGKPKVHSVHSKPQHDVKPAPHHVPPPPKHKPTPKPAPLPVTKTDNVKNFGATGDGKTDDTKAIEKAIGDAVANKRGVYFPSGTYLHNNTLTFNGLAVTGVGSSSILKAGDNNNSAVILTGQSPSIQSIFISTAGLPGNADQAQLNGAAVLVQNASQFTVARCSIVQGPSRVGLSIISSTSGNVSSSVLAGLQSLGEVGIAMWNSSHITLTNNLLTNEEQGISVSPGPGEDSTKNCSYLSITNNTIGNKSSPTESAGIADALTNYLTITGNQIQMSATGTPLVFVYEPNMFVSQNTLDGGLVGILFTSTNSRIPLVGSNTISNNTIGNCAYGAISIGTCLSPSGGIKFDSNQLGECGLASANNSIIFVSDAGMGFNSSNLSITNNVYTGHKNYLNWYVFSDGLSLVNVSGNTQKYTTLPSQLY